MTGRAGCGADGLNGFETGGDYDEVGVRGRFNPKVGRGDEVDGGDSSVTFFFKDNTLRGLASSSDINIPLTEAFE